MGYRPSGRNLLAPKATGSYWRTGRPLCRPVSWPRYSTSTHRSLTWPYSRYAWVCWGDTSYAAGYCARCGQTPRRRPCHVVTATRTGNGVLPSTPSNRPRVATFWGTCRNLSSSSTVVCYCGGPCRQTASFLRPSMTGTGLVGSRRSRLRTWPCRGT